MINKIFSNNRNIPFLHLHLKLLSLLTINSLKSSYLLKNKK